jgi:hypothetical protein
LDKTEVNPKAGMQWDITDKIRLRMAYLETLKRALVVDQTLEPTQVAGFNQFFDDTNGTDTQRFGIGLDARLASNVYAGVEASWRNLKVPVLNVGNGLFSTEEQEEQLIRSYIDWTIDTNWVVTAEIGYERLHREEIDTTILPREIETIMVPLTLRYFHPSGFFAQFGPTYVHQHVDLSPLIAFPKDSDDFVLFDAAVGYRFPERMGIASLELRNLLDKKFLFQETDLQGTRPSNPLFIPEITVLGRVTLNF